MPTERAMSAQGYMLRAQVRATRAHSRGRSAMTETADPLTRRATFHAMTEGTAEDWQAISAHFFDYGTHLTERVMDHMLLLSADHGGFAVSRLEHCLQTATRAVRANRD